MPLRRPDLMDPWNDSNLQRTVVSARVQGEAKGSTSYSFTDDPQDSGTFNFAPAVRRQPVQEFPSYNDLDRDQLRRPASRDLMQDLLPYDDFGRDQSDYESFQPPAPSSSSHRLSLAPRSVPTLQETRAITNADNYFKVQANLRHGMPFSRVPAAQNNNQHHSPMTQLVNDMLLPPSAAQASPEPNIFWRSNQNRFSQLQPQKQQVTPPFNLGGYSNSPSALANANSSSPYNTNSSPSNRLSLRRSAVRPQPPTNQRAHEQDVGDHRPVPETPRKQIIANPVEGIRSMITRGHAPPIAHGIQLISPQDLAGDRTRAVFPYELFNAVQSKCFAPIYKTDDNVVVSAPTGSGKTALLELAICRLVDAHQSSTQYKIVYMAPTKSLCSERVRDWQQKFSHMALACAELTGDTGQSEMSKVRNASIIVTTPEKWDSITRKWKDHGKLLEMVKLFLIDEVHFLNDPRGATLEAVVSRMKTSGANVRFVALSATVPNSHDIATWLGKDHTNNLLPAHRETFGESFRPVKLQKHVHGIDGPRNDFAFDLTLDGKLPTLIAKYTHKKPMMVFCLTKKSCEKTAALLAETWTRQRPADRAWPAPAEHVHVSKELQDLASCGVAYHHAGLDVQDRHTIESAFLKGNISVICCTSTLAVGVNLPCHLVILKGTVCFRGAGTEEYSDLEVMQMLGRAGRPQFDDSAVAIIMTRNDRVKRYEKMISGQDILESTLHLNLIEHLNSEIGLGTICNIYSAKQWLGGTFLSVRMRQHPEHYKIAGMGPWQNTDEQLQWVCDRDIKLLQAHKLVTEGNPFRCTEYGEAMSRYMVQFETMKLLLGVPLAAKVESILEIVCQAAEFKDVRMKANERSHLRELNKSPFLKYPVKEAISTTAHKVSLLIQVQLGGIDLPTDKDFIVSLKRQFQTDKNMIFERIQRLVRCVVDCKVVDCDAIAARNALDLARALSAGFWEDSSLQLRQIPQIGPVAMRKLDSNDVKTIEKLAILDSAGIERVFGRNPPFGRKMQEILATFPRLTIVGEVLDRIPSISGQPVKVQATVKLSIINEKIPVWNRKAPSVILTAETCDGTLVHFWRGPIGRLQKSWDEKFVAEMSCPEDEILCQLSCDDIVGTVRSVILKHEIPASEFPPPKPKPQIQTHATKTEEIMGLKDEFGGDDFEDDELLAAVNNIEGSDINEGFEDCESSEDEPAPNASIVVKSKTTKVSEPIRMKNGKYQCNHHCRGGLLLKNGKPCKHRCCHEGLDRPRKVKERRKSSGGIKNEQESVMGSGIVGVKSKVKGSKSEAKKEKAAKQFKQLKLGASKSSNKDEEIEVIDFSKVLSPTPFSSLAPRDFRKLHSLHTSVQEDKPIRTGNNKPKFAYASGDDPLSFLDPQEKNDIEGGRRTVSPLRPHDDSDGFPSPSRLGQEGKAAAPFEDYDDDPFNTDSIKYGKPAPTSLYVKDSGDLEMGMVDFGDSMLLQDLKLPMPEISRSFEDSLLDFSSYNDEVEAQLLEKASSPSINPTRDLKRARGGDSQDSPEAKRCRSISDEKLEQTNVEPTLLAWLSGFDPELVGVFKDVVEFVD